MIEHFDEPESRVHFLDGHFYEFHDEWYWFQLLNGVSVADEDAVARGPRFPTPSEAARWARGQRALPLGLRFAEDRLYSDAFYDQALKSDRELGIGTLIYLPSSDTRPALWGFELEYVDAPAPETVERFRRILRQALPRAMGENLRWLTRSPEQQRIARELAGRGSKVQALQYADLATAGESEVYATGLRVGRLLRLDGTRSTIERATVRDVLVVPEPLDDLPPAAGVISLVPLTPLSHFNVLARQRGIPCVYVGELERDPYFNSLLRAGAPVLLDARPDGVWMSAMSEAEYGPFNVLENEDVRSLPLPDVATMPYVRTLAELTRTGAVPSLAEVGGKMLGFVTLASLPESQRPSPVVALTVRAYAEHIAPLEPTLRALVDHPEFRASAPLRLLLLEGTKAFESAFDKPEDFAIVAQRASSSNVLSEVLAQGGVQAMIRQRAIAPATMAQIEAELSRAFASISPEQGLRFRSSSTLEDIEAFNGAGLYDSSTGYFGRHDKKSLESAIKKTWASYWTYRAFEERSRAQLDTLSGRMAVVVHPRFDDAHELANAVLTFTLFSPEAPLVSRMEVNAQHGALSVTNPPVDRASALPEITRVELARAPQASPQITRIRPSTEVSPGEAVFDDRSLENVFAALTPLAERWLTEHTRDVPPEQRARMVTLDLEARRVSPEWPASSKTYASEPRWVIKQVRSLDPAPEIPGLGELDLPLPADVLARTVKIVRRTCEQSGLRAELLDAHMRPVDGSSLPSVFVGSLLLEEKGRSVMLTHLDMRATSPTHFEFSGHAATRAARNMLDLSGSACTSTVEAASLGERLHDIAARARRLGKLAP